MRQPDEFADAFNGTRARAGRVAVYLGSADMRDAADLPDAKVGFVVSKKVGNSVVRHRIARQLRHIVRPWISSGKLAPGESLVVRALPGSAGSTSAQFAADMDTALSKIRRKAAAASGRGATQTASSPKTPGAAGPARAAEVPSGAAPTHACGPRADADGTEEQA